MIALLAFLLGVVAVACQPTPPPASFTDGMAAGWPVVEDGVIGWEWQCGDERCYAVLDTLMDEFYTGP